MLYPIEPILLRSEVRWVERLEPFDNIVILSSPIVRNDTALKVRRPECIIDQDQVYVYLPARQHLPWSYQIWLVLRLVTRWRDITMAGDYCHNRLVISTKFYDSNAYATTIENMIFVIRMQWSKFRMESI